MIILTLYDDSKSVQFFLLLCVIKNLLFLLLFTEITVHTGQGKKLLA